MENVSVERIESFFEGSNPQKYIVAVEANYYTNSVSLIINDPVRGKYIEKDVYKPFVWMKDSALDLLYGGNRIKLKTEMRKAGINAKVLTTANEEGFEPDRLKNGYKYLITTTKTCGELMNFFKTAGVEVTDSNRHFIYLTPTEQYLIQSGKRLFKGMEEYDEVHRLQFDLETTSLDPKIGRIFKIGMKDNRGFEHIISIDGDENILDRELEAIKTMFEVIDALKPDIIAGYYSENFDWPFIIDRCEILNEKVESIAKTLNSTSKLKRKKATLKLGGDVEYYEQTYMWGYNIIDNIHSVRRAQAINSDIKESGLKYITKFSEVAKENRVYIPGSKIFQTAADKEHEFAFNNINGDWYKITETNPLKEGYEITDGNYIVDRYLLDDLWETEQVDNIFNQASFLLAKLLPTSYMRTITMGTAGIWKLIMLCWSYENGLAIPEHDKKRDFTGGLSRLFVIGYSEDAEKLDYAALYPNVGLTWDIFPQVDITRVMPGLLLYIAETRDKYKGLKNKYEAEGDTKKGGFFDKKQLPLKILANSFFGSLSAPQLFPWGDIDCGEEITCRGRMSLRLMVKYFMDKHKFNPLNGDTDGINFAVPPQVKNYTYISNGKHRFNEKGKTYTGIDAAVAEFNDIYMNKRMGLDIDEHYKAIVNFARKNYVVKVIKKGKEKIKLVGNSIKSKKMPTYIEEFFDEAFKLLLNGKGYEFINYYYDYVDEIYNYRIPVAKIASKSKVKLDLKEYLAKGKKKNKAGKPMPKQAHMELIIQNNLNLNIGDVVYYVNVGKAKGDGDIKTDKKTGIVGINCKLISNEQLEENPNLLTDEYNVAKYLAAFNTKIKQLLVVFSPEIRDSIIINIRKDKKTKVEVLEDRKYFNEDDCKMINGIPFEPEDQDDLQLDLMDFEDKELKFWSNTNKMPNYLKEIGLSDEEFETIKKEYVIRYKEKHNSDIIKEKENFDKIAMALELSQLSKLNEEISDGDEAVILKLQKMLPFLVLEYFDSENESEEGMYYFLSKKYGDQIASVSDLFKYTELAEERADFYKTIPEVTKEDRYNVWLEKRNKELNVDGINDGDRDDVKENDAVSDTVKIKVKTVWDDDSWNF